MSVEKPGSLKRIDRKFPVAQLDAHHRTMARLHLIGKGMTPKEADTIVDLERRRRSGRFS